MKKSILSLAALIIYGILTSNAAAVDVSGLYVGVKGLYSYTLMEDTRSQYVTMIQSMTFADKSENSFGGALSVGYDFNKRFEVPVRAELEYAVFSKVGTKRSYVFGCGDAALGEQKFKVQTLFLNVYYDFDLGTAITPYINGGAGWAFIDTKLYSHSINRINQGIDSSSITRTNFAWNLGMGAMYRLTANISLDAGYRFVSLGSVKTKNAKDYFNNPFYLKTKNLEMHQIYLGLHYTF